MALEASRRLDGQRARQPLGNRNAADRGASHPPCVFDLHRTNYSPAIAVMLTLVQAPLAFGVGVLVTLVVWGIESFVARQQLALWLLRKAARQLPPRDRDRFEEERLAVMALVDGSVKAVLLSLLAFRSARELRALLRSLPAGDVPSDSQL
jgi:hypothetical protein